MNFKSILSFIFLLVTTLLSSSAVLGQDTEKITKVLEIVPRMSNVDIDVPNADELKSCKLERGADVVGFPGYVLYDGNGQVIRQYLAIQDESKLDTWSFFKTGIEVYRESDTNGDETRDQYRWLGTGGTRWGIDSDKDGKIDFWKIISPEEVVEEVFTSVREKDLQRFEATLITSEELSSLGLSSELAAAVQRRLDAAKSEFNKFCGGVKSITSKSEYVHFGSSRPSLLPKDIKKDSTQKDVTFYDNTSAVFSEGGKFGQLSIGTLIKVGDAWRAVELPAMLEDGQTIGNGGVLLNSLRGSGLAANEGVSEKMAELFEKFEKLEVKINESDPGKELDKLEVERASVLLQLVVASSGDENRKNWIRQLADTLATSFETKRFTKALDVLMQAKTKLEEAKIVNDLDYIDYRIITSRFSASADGNSRERNEATETFQKALTEFIENYPKSEYSAEGLMQLALYAEVNATSDTEISKSVAFYDDVLTRFPDTKFAKRAAGAKTRLTCIGKTLAFVGKTTTNQKFDLSNSALRGRVVVIHYWATNCASCVADFEELQRLSAKYKGDLVIVGANLDDNQADMTKFLDSNPNYKWPQLFAEGGTFGSELAEQLGVTTLPLTILIDQTGKVVETRIAATELDRDIQSLIDK